MFRLLLSFSLILFSFCTHAQNYKPVEDSSKVHFIIQNFSLDIGGDISGLTGDIHFVPSKVSNSRFDVSVEVSTIDTDNANRDKHLRNKDYFNVEEYPNINLKSTKINRTNKSSSGWYHFTGVLTMRGVSKGIAFPFRAIKKGNDYLFVGGFTINRLDFGVGKSSAVLSNSVKVSMSVLAKKS